MTTSATLPCAGCRTEDSGRHQRGAVRSGRDRGGNATRSFFLTRWRPRNNPCCADPRSGPVRSAPSQAARASMRSTPADPWRRRGRASRNAPPPRRTERDRDRHAESGGDDLGDLAHRHALLGDGMLARAGFVLVERQPVEPRHVAHMRGRPAVGAVADIGGHAFLAGDLDGRGDQPLLPACRGPAAGARRDGHAASWPAPRPASSDRRRGLGLSRSNTSSVAGTPGPALPMPVPEVMISGRSEPASTSPIAWMTRRSFSQFSTKRENAWSKAVWMTASASAAPRAMPCRVFQRAAMRLRRRPAPASVRRHRNASGQ